MRQLHEVPLYEKKPAIGLILIVRPQVDEDL